MAKVLVIAAHPDDELLGVGGTIIKHNKAGDKVYVVILGEGQTSRYINRDNVPIEVLDSLNKNSIAAGKILGITKSYFASFPDNRFDKIDLLDIIKEIEKIIAEVNPDIIYTHYNHDLNIDHCLTHKGVLTASRPVEGCNVKEIYAFETLSASEWNFTSKVFRPNYYVDISHELDQKIQAMKEYSSEIRNWPHPRSDEGIKTLAKYRGMQVGVNYAEAFEVVRIIKR